MRARADDAGPNESFPEPSELVERVLGVLEEHDIPKQTCNDIVGILEMLEGARPAKKLIEIQPTDYSPSELIERVGALMDSAGINAKVWDQIVAVLAHCERVNLEGAPIVRVDFQASEVERLLKEITDKTVEDTLKRFQVEVRAKVEAVVTDTFSRGKSSTYSHLRKLLNPYAWYICIAMTVAFGIARAVLPGQEGGLRQADTFKDCAHFFVGALFAFSCAYGSWRWWGLFWGLTAVEVVVAISHMG